LYFFCPLFLCEVIVEDVPCYQKRRDEGSHHSREGIPYSKIKMADAITVVQRPRLSPTPLWVMLVVRTILLEIR